MYRHLAARAVDLVPGLVTVITSALGISVAIVATLLPQLAHSVHVPRVVSLADGVFAALGVALARLRPVYTSHALAVLWTDARTLYMSLFKECSFS